METRYFVLALVNKTLCTIKCKQDSLYSDSCVINLFILFYSRPIIWTQIWKNCFLVLVSVKTSWQTKRHPNLSTISLSSLVAWMLSKRRWGSRVSAGFMDPYKMFFLMYYFCYYNSWILYSLLFLYYSDHIQYLSHQYC